MARTCVSRRAKSTRPVKAEEHVAHEDHQGERVSHTGVRLTKFAGNAARVRDAVFAGAVTSFTSTVRSTYTWPRSFLA
jgi:hypothetical protein